MVSGGRSGRVERVEVGKFGGMGCTGGRKSWVGVVADNAKTVAEGVVRRAGNEWLGCRVEWMKREVGNGRVADGLRFGRVESKGVVEGG